jgi:hypothetical protein
MAKLYKIARQLVVPGAARLIQQSDGLVYEQDMHHQSSTLSLYIQPNPTRPDYHQGYAIRFQLTFDHYLRKSTKLIL